MFKAFNAQQIVLACDKIERMVGLGLNRVRNWAVGIPFDSLEELRTGAQCDQPMWVCKASKPRKCLLQVGQTISLVSYSPSSLRGRPRELRQAFVSCNTVHDNAVCLPLNTEEIIIIWLSIIDFYSDDHTAIQSCIIISILSITFISDSYKPLRL